MVGLADPAEEGTNGHSTSKNYLLAPVHKQVQLEEEKGLTVVGPGCSPGNLGFVARAERST